MSESLIQALAERILVLDGAMGTQIQNRNLTAADFGGNVYEGCNEQLVLTRPDVIASIHRSFLEAGADIIETDTFGACDIVLAEYGLESQVFEINRRAAEIARSTCAEMETPGRPRWVAGSMGPSTRTISVTGGVTYGELVRAFQGQAMGLLAGGVDLLLLETAQDTLNLKAASEGIWLAFGETGWRVPLMISATIEPTGTMLAGQGVEALYASITHLEDHLGLLSIGLNCATGPEFMTDHLRSLSALASCHVSVYPNAGLPDEFGHYGETPASLAGKLARFVDEGWINIVGGCCGTTPAHIAAIAEMVRGKAPRRANSTPCRIVSGIEALFIEEDARPVLVGERTNVIGSRRFKDLIVAGQFEEGSEIARAQVKGGAQVIDICVANPDRDELADMQQLLQFLPRKVRVPLMIDSTDALVMEAALQRLQGKCILNSINLEDGEDRFARVVPLLQLYGGAVVVGCIDEDPRHGMAVTRQRKLEIARRSHDLLVNRYGLRPEDLIFDPLVFPAGTGDQNYIGSAAETIEGVRLISQEFPRSSTLLGISNVSFGLPPAGREVLNSVFLHHCVKAGLTYAIVNTEKLVRYAGISDKELALADDLIFWRGSDPVAAFAAHFRSRSPRAASATAELPLDERLSRYIVEGSKDGLIDDLEAAVTRGDRALAIINGPLLAGMDEVGRLFNDNQLIVAEVLQSAEAMKTAVAYLEPLLDRSESSSKGTMLLATVKGDVHDIGKNLVEIIFSNNGFRIINLGIKVPPEELIAAVRREKPDYIGLSGLLVKSAQQMAVTAADLKVAGIDLPLLVGGAALSRRYADTRIAAEYGGPVLFARDAMSGLAIVNRLAALNQRPALLAELAERQKEARREAAGRTAASLSGPSLLRSAVRLDLPLPPPPDFTEHILRDIPLDHVLPYINRQVLFSKHLGLSGVLGQLLADGDEKALRLNQTVQGLIEQVRSQRLIRPQALYRFFPAAADGNDLVLFDPDGSAAEVARFHFPRQSGDEHLCLADFVRPLEIGLDSVPLFVTTCGTGVRELSERWKGEGEYLKSHLLQALALELAESTAEFVHRRIRDAWGISDDPTLSMADLLDGRYRSVRFSPGYACCPDMADQETFFRLLKPQRIGMQLTEGFMMDPEASVSALVFHHPESCYFSVQR